jgi:hypothetical protein
MPTDAETPEAPAGNEQAGLIPATFQLGGLQWSVKFSEDIDCFGSCHIDTAVIKINATYPMQVQEVTFLHELMHAIYFAKGIRDHDEKEIDSVATFLHQFLLTQQGQA